MGRDESLMERKRVTEGGNWMMNGLLETFKPGDLIYKHCVSLCCSEYLRAYRYIGISPKCECCGLFEIIPIGTSEILKVTRMDKDDIGRSFKRYPSERYVAIDQLPLPNNLKHEIYLHICKW